MMRHRVIVSTTAPAAIRREEYERALHRFRHVRMPIEQTPLASWGLFGIAVVVKFVLLFLSV